MTSFGWRPLEEVSSLHNCPTCGHQMPVGEQVQLLLAGGSVGSLHLSPTQRIILGRLLKSSATTEQLAQEVYADRIDPPLLARENVRVALHYLRKRLGEDVLPRQQGHAVLQMVQLDALEKALERAA